MKLAIVETDENTGIETYHIKALEYDKMSALQADMAKHPERYEDGKVYTLVEDKPRLRVKSVTKTTVEVVK